MKLPIHVLLTFLFATSSVALAVDGAKKNDGMAASDSEITKIWDEWDGMLKQFVDPRDGRVAYLEFHKNMGDLEKHLGRYKKIDPSKWSDDKKKAAYINFYNAGMIYNILRHADEKKINVASKKFLDLRINKISVPGGNIWSGNYKFALNGEKVHLDNIEHGLIRGEASGKLGRWKVKKLDPRIHAAVNCAAASCPRVREVAYRESNIDKMLEENVNEWLNNPDQFKKLSDSKLKANQITYWYYGDFDTHGKKVLKKKGAGDYLATFVNEANGDGKWVASHLRKNFNDRSKFSLKLTSAFSFHYDWQINDQRNRPGGQVSKAPSSSSKTR